MTGIKRWPDYVRDGSVGLALIVGVLVYDRRRLAKESRSDFGQCLICGYDLRATPDRCPECGAMPERSGS
jgi:hypothetical protein